MAAIIETTWAKTKVAEPVVAYTPTLVDADKATADFRIIDVTCRLKRIVWRDGTQQDVTAAELRKLETQHTWACDF